MYLKKYKQKTINYNLIQKYVLTNILILNDYDFQILLSINYKKNKDILDVCASFLLLELAFLQRPYLKKHTFQIAHLGISLGDVSTIKVNLRSELTENCYLQLLNLYFISSELHFYIKTINIVKTGLLIKINNFFMNSKHLLNKEYLLIEYLNNINISIQIKPKQMTFDNNMKLIIYLSHLQFPF